MSDSADSTAAGADETSTPARPLLRVLRGGVPSDEEVAAVVAVLAARSAETEPEPERPLRSPLTPWVSSGLVKGTRTKA